MQDELPSKAIASNGRTGDEVSKATAGKVVAKHWYKCIRRLLPAQIKVTQTGATGGNRGQGGSKRSQGGSKRRQPRANAGNRGQTQATGGKRSQTQSTGCESARLNIGLKSAETPAITGLQALISDISSGSQKPLENRLSRGLKALV